VVTWKTTLLWRNVGFVFTKGELTEIRQIIMDNKVAAPAKAGALAPDVVKVPPQNTGLGPEKTSFFQALNIPTKISKGTIEILNEVKLLSPGDRVGASEATLLNMLNISPFTYGLLIEQVYDSGTVFDLRKRFMEGVVNLACVSLAMGYPTIASVPHIVVNGFKNLLAIAAATEVEFKEAATIKEFLKDPSKFAAVTAAVTEAPAAEEAKEEAKAASESEEEDDDMGFGLFD